MRGRDSILNFSVDRYEVSWRNVFLSSTMINKMLDKPVIVASVFKFLLARPASIKWILLEINLLIKEMNTDIIKYTLIQMVN